MPRRPLVLATALTAAVGLSACGSQENSVKDTAQVERGAQLFINNCAMCHSLDVVGAQGSATKIKDRERPDGPNFNVRKEDRESILYAIRNGGFSGAIMPENIVVGADAEAVAAFLEKYAGRDTGDAGQSQSNPGSSGDGVR